MAVDVTSDAIFSAPKALLHDHLDGGLRIETILELSEAIGWTPQLPTTDPTDLQAWFTAGAAAKDLLKYLATFEHTLAVMQDPAHIERVAFEAVGPRQRRGCLRRNTFRSGIARHAIRSFGRGDLRRLSTSRSLSPREGSLNLGKSHRLCDAY